MDLAKVLAELRAAGVTEAEVWDVCGSDKGIEHVRVTFGTARVGAPAGFVDEAGAPVNLDEGMGVLEKDPLEAAEAEQDPIRRKNFDVKKEPDGAD